jgi:hypothetical protein
LTPLLPLPFTVRLFNKNVEAADGYGSAPFAALTGRLVESSDTLLMNSIFRTCKDNLLRGLITLKGTVHILNGQEMYNYFKKTHFLEQELLIPFNEAMCYGDTCNDLFSKEFIDLRSKVHQVTITQYSEITLKPLKPFFRGDFSRIILWFDTDMFCQINLLTILAWLDHTNYQGEVELHLVDDNFKLIDNCSLEVDVYENLYKQVLINKETPEHIEPTSLKKGVELYLNYLEQDSDLMLYIQRHQDVHEKELVSLLLKKFKEYGLGDTQYAELIKSYRNKHLKH